jgi:hypothetical protein
MITPKNILSSRWEDILKNKEINDIFSIDGINNYTNSSAKINMDDIAMDNNIMVNDITLDNDSRRIIVSTPFNIRTVTSYGLMVFAKDTKRWVIVRDKHNAEYILIIKGYYRPTFTKFLLSKITPEESKTIKDCLTSTIDVFIDLYLNKLNLEKNGLLYAIVRMAESRNNILEMINNLDISNNTLPWTWPKGRIQHHVFKETDFECAIREFKEEVEIDLPPSILNSDKYIEENIVTLTGRKLESRFWIYVIPNELELHKPINNPEVCDRIWVDTETCVKLIPKAMNHINLFKKVINSTS